MDPFAHRCCCDLKRVHLDRHLGRRLEVGQEHELPAPELRAVAEVEVLGQRVVLPAAAVGDRLGPPDARGAVEVEEAAGPVAPAVLEHEVGVEQDRLDLGQQRVVLVDVRPARLHHRDASVGEVRHRALQEVHRRDEVGVEDRDVAARRHLQRGVERAGLEAVAVVAVDVLDVEALRGVALHGQPGDVARLVGRVVEDLDFQPVLRVVHPADGLHEAVHHVHLVVERQLHGHRRPRVRARPASRLCRPCASCKDTQGSSGASRRRPGCSG